MAISRAILKQLHVVVQKHGEEHPAKLRQCAVKNVAGYMAANQLARKPLPVKYGRHKMPLSMVAGL